MRRLGPLLLLLLVSCGQEDAGIGESAAATLEPQVQQVRAAATSGDRAGAARELAELRRTVAVLRQRGELSEDGAARVLAAAAEVEARLGAAPTPATEVPPTTRGQSGTGGTTRTAREAEEEARKRAEDAARKAEEEAKKRADEVKKRAEEGKKD